MPLVLDKPIHIGVDAGYFAPTPPREDVVEPYVSSGGTGMFPEAPPANGKAYIPTYTPGRPGYPSNG